MARILDLGRMGYHEAWDVQKQIQNDLIEGVGEETLIFVEHPPILTLGASFHEENLLFTREQYEKMGIEVAVTDRGGDVTTHMPDQLVIYPVFDVSQHGKDLHKWMRDLEETIILTVREFGVDGERFAPHTGVWTKGKKVAAIGVKIKKWISTHGIALNCSNSLDIFNMIIPCGIVGHGVTSLSREVGRTVSIDEAKPIVAQSFEQVFGLKF